MLLVLLLLTTKRGHVRRQHNGTATALRIAQIPVRKNPMHNREADLTHFKSLLFIVETPTGMFHKRFNYKRSNFIQQHVFTGHDIGTTTRKLIEYMMQIFGNAIGMRRIVV